MHGLLLAAAEGRMRFGMTDMKAGTCVWGHGTPQRRKKAEPPPRRAQHGTFARAAEQPPATSPALPARDRRDKRGPAALLCAGADRTAPGHRCSSRLRRPARSVSLPECTAAQRPPGGLPTAPAALLEAAGRLHGPRSAL